MPRRAAGSADEVDAPMSSHSPSPDPADGDDRNGYATDTCEDGVRFPDRSDEERPDPQTGLIPSIYYKRLLAANVAISRLQDRAILYNKKNGQEVNLRSSTFYSYRSSLIAFHFLRL